MALFLCCLLGIVSLVYGQPLSRLAASNEPDGTDHTGEIISFSDVGSGVGADPPAWYCYTNPGGVVWQGPSMSVLPIVWNRGAVDDELFISGSLDPAAVVLHRGPTHFSPDGEHCCVRITTNDRRCVTFTPCPTLSPVSNGMISYDAASNLATYSCVTGYTLTGTSSFITCNDTTMQWSSTERPTCELLCPDLTAPDNGGVMYSHTTTPKAEGSTATYICATGYQMTGLMVRMCTATGWSTGDDPVCTVYLSLGSTNITNNTEISITDIGQDAEGGLPSLTCHTDLTACCRGSADNYGRGSLGQWRYPDGSVILGNSASLTAGDGFYIFRNAPQLIRLNRRENNNPLTPTGPYCCVIPTTGGEMTFCANLVVCLSLPRPTNGIISYSDPILGVGSVATFSCDPGFMISDATHSSSNCQADGQWSSSISPTCLGSCPALDIENGMVTYYGDTMEPYIYGTTAVCECNLGYELTSGDSEKTCTGDVRSSVGEWSGATVVCSVVDCGQPTPPSNGEVSLPTGTAFSSVAHYSCHPCYRHVGVSLQICGGNGLWVPAPPTCEILDCDRPPDLDNGIITTPYTTTCSSVVTYSCDRGYLLEGVSSRSCQTNEEWSNGTALCNPIDCGSLSSPDNGGVVLLSGSTFMSRATYSCDSGYPLRGPAVRTCGPDGRWSQYPPSCEPVNCGPLMNPTNGRVDTSSGTTFMNRATYTCNTGHNLVGTSSRMCLASGMWSSLQPTCEVVDCGALEYPTNGKVVILQGTTFDQPAMYSCNEGYTLNGDARRTCTVSGQWTGSAPSCDPMDCGDLEAPANGNVTTSQGTYFMDIAVYSCAPGYNLTGCPSAVCQSNGTWSCDPPFCADNTMIQLKFGPTSYCVEWTDEKVKLMYRIMHIAITKAIGKSGYDIPMNNIQPGYFICYESTTRTTYRTTITGTKSLSAVEYAELISEWVESGVTTRVLWYAIRMDKACPVVIASMDKDECE